MHFVSKPTHGACFVPSKTYRFYLHEVLFPFQLYLLSQADGDASCQRTESVILEGYLMLLLSLCVRVVNNMIGWIQERPEEEPVLFTSLNESVLGVLLCLIAFVFILVVLVKTLAFGDPVGGWPSMICVILFLGGVQLLCIGILGQYLSKTYLETKRRPIYLVRETEEGIK